MRGDGRIVVVGYGIAGVDRYNALALGLTERGSIDPRFGRNGRFRFQFGQLTTFSAVTEAPDQTLVIGGAAGKHNNAKLAVFRLRPDGRLDTTFNGRGYVTREVDPGGRPLSTDQR